MGLVVPEPCHTDLEKESVLELRRAHVARLKLAGLTASEIYRRFQEEEYGPPEGWTNSLGQSERGRTWSLGVICNDLKELTERWRSESSEDTQEHKNRILAEIEEVKRKGHAVGDLNVVLSAIRQERELRGLNNPEPGVTINVIGLGQSLNQKLGRLAQATQQALQEEEQRQQAIEADFVIERVPVLEAGTESESKPVSEFVMSTD